MHRIATARTDGHHVEAIAYSRAVDVIDLQGICMRVGGWLFQFECVGTFSLRHSLLRCPGWYLRFKIEQ